MPGASPLGHIRLMRRLERITVLRTRWLLAAIAIASVVLGLSLPSGGASQAAEVAPAARAAAPPTRTPDDYYVYLPLVTAGTSGGEVHPNDPYYDEEWGLEAVEAAGAWGISCGCSTVVIAVIDTGTDLDHPDLAAKVRTDVDYDFVNHDNIADDDHGHGTHVSGIAAAATDNSLGVAGLGWDTSILPLKALDQNGYGSTSNVEAAIYYAADNGADVINLSMAAAAPCPPGVQEAVDYAYARGVVVVAAAGNHGDETNAEAFPANCEHVLGIGATEPDDVIAGYSNYGNHVSIAAPGSAIYSTLPGGNYGYKWGTSMATPHAAGLAALLRAHYSSYTPDQIASAILDNAEDLGATGWDPYYGCGRVNAFRALATGAHGAYPVCLGARTWSAGAAEAPATAPFAPGEILVSFQPGVQAEQTARRYGASADFVPGIRAWRLHVPPGQEQTILARLLADPAVEYASLDYRVSIQ